MSLLQEKIKELESKLKSYSRGLENKNYLLNKSWTIVDGDLRIQRLIFKNNGVLYITSEGLVSESTWEYLPSVNALIIKIGNDKILFHEVYLNHVALILKKDSSNSQFVALVNPDKLQDLNLENYLNGFDLNFKLKHGNSIPYNKNKNFIDKIFNLINGK
jgi:hypothetical protein